MAKNNKQQAQRRAQRKQRKQMAQQTATAVETTPAVAEGTAVKRGEAKRKQKAQRAGTAAKAKRGTAKAAKRNTARNKRNRQAALPAGVTARRNAYFIADQVPVNGAGGTAAGKAAPGMLCVDRSAGLIYVNIGTLNEPAWKPATA